MRSRSKLRKPALIVLIALAVLIVVVSGLTASGTPAPAAAPTEGRAWFTGLALIFVLLTYGGWNEAANRWLPRRRRSE